MCPCPPQDPLSTLERDLALQLQIAEAARCLSREENLAKQVRKRRKSAVLKEEKKLKDLEQALSEYRLAARRHSSPLTASAPALEGELNVSNYGSPNLAFFNLEIGIPIAYELSCGFSATYPNEKGCGLQHHEVKGGDI